MKKKFQVVFPCSEDDSMAIHQRFQSDAQVMKDVGIHVGVSPLEDSTILMYKGFILYGEDNYPKDERYINTYKEYAVYQYLSQYYPHIADLSIETFFVDDLDDSVAALIKAKGWDKAFIKKDSKALEHVDEGKSVWPNTSFEEMKNLYKEFKTEGKYAIRKFIEPHIIEQEMRYWVFNGNIYKKDNIIPDVVKEAAKRLDKLGSKYYTIDATPDFIVEVNPGESSDRHAVNSAELFASWIKKEFAM